MKDDSITDAILVDRFQHGDINAMDQLIKRHQARAYQFAYRLTEDRDMAADVVGETFLRLYRSTHLFKGQSSFTTWMFRVVTNCFLDLQKKAVRRPSTSLDSLPFEQDREALTCDTEGLSPHDILLASQQQESILAKTSSLPDFQRVMITLFHWEMLTYEEIAQTLDLPIGTVKSRLNRARMSLRGALGPEQTLFIDYPLCA